MKYLFINVTAVRSTGRIVTDQCRKLMEQGHECRIAYGRTEFGTTDLPAYVIGGKFDVLCHAAQSRLLDNHAFASRLATKRFLNWVRDYDPDVIWLHNLHGYYIHVGMLFDYLRTSGKKIYWTLHDCWTFTGHCSHFEKADCDRWKNGCGHCPQKGEYPASLIDRSTRNYERKKKAFTGVPNLTFVVPCHWMKRLLKQSFLAEYPVEVVPNTIDLATFCPTESDFRRQYDLENKYMVLGVSSVWDDTKGLSCFLHLAEQLDDCYRIVLVGMPEELAKTMPPKILPILRTENAKELAKIYSAADVFVNPTIEDTFPTVNLEAAACGCRVVTYDTGGCPETVGPEDIVVPRRDEAQLLQCIRRVCEQST